MGLRKAAGNYSEESKTLFTLFSFKSRSLLSLENLYSLGHSVEPELQAAPVTVILHGYLQAANHISSPCSPPRLTPLS